MATNTISGKLPVKGGGVCIYCYSDGDGRKFGDEHILQYSLGGPAELEGASCWRCEGVTSYLDGYLANEIFRELRTHLDIQSRSGHPEALTTAIEKDGAWREFIVPTADHPFILAMPVWKKPGILRGAPMSADFGRVFVHAYEFVPHTAAQALGLQTGEKVQVRYPRKPPNPVPFARALAKFAYCDGVRMYGLGGFRPLATRDIILGKYPNIPYFIGADSLGPPPPPRAPGEQHSVTQTTIAFGRITLLVAEVRLFADAHYEGSGMPIYHVVYGARGGGPVSPKPLAPRLPRSISL